jgi:hypothetical protein
MNDFLSFAAAISNVFSQMSESSFKDFYKIHDWGK